ncbi:hypothetical protein COOONC_13801, partial [Cooperia oncophora]
LVTFWTFQVSLYKPETAEAGHNPTLLISNAAKNDAARLGYIPPPPKPVLEFASLPPEYNNTQNYPGYRPEAPVTQPTTVEPFHLEVPTKGPHVFMPPQNFPAPSSPTTAPRVVQTTSQPSYSPTAKTIPTEAPPELPSSTTARYYSSEGTTHGTSCIRILPIGNYHPQTAYRGGEVSTESPHTTRTVSTEVPGPYETTLPPWSPTYKTVPTRALTTVGTTPSRVSFESPTTPSTPTYVSVETPPQFTRPSISTANVQQPTTPLSSHQEEFTPSHGFTPFEESLTTPPRVPSEVPTSPSREVPTTPSREVTSTRPGIPPIPPQGEIPGTSTESSSGRPPTTLFGESSPTPSRETSTSPFEQSNTTPREYQPSYSGGTPTAPSQEFTVTPTRGSSTPSEQFTPFQPSREIPP